MKRSKQIISGVLSLAITGSTCTSLLPAALAENITTDNTIKSIQTKGEIAITINFALPQSYQNVVNRNIELKLTKDSISSVVTLSNGSVSNGLLSSAQVSVSKMNTQGSEMSDETQIGSYNVVLSDLELGDYTVELSGTGYSTITEEISLSDYSKHLIVSTDNGTFSLGDFDLDASVGLSDFLLIKNALGSEVPEDIQKFDLDGDGKIDVTDLSYINNNKDLTGTPKVIDTNYIAPVSVDNSFIQTENGSIEDIFTAGNDNPVTIKPTDDSSGEIAIPITLSQNDTPVEVSEIKITSPASNGAIESGVAVVELADGTQKEINFNQLETARFMRNAAQNTITINLGSKVAIKKVTIKVTKVAGDTDYASVSQIEFLKDTTSNITAEDNTKVKNLSAYAGDKSVELSWSSVSNITGYRVYYGTDKNSLNDTVEVSTNRASISGLENNQTYYFKVVAVNGDWSGTESSIVSATPISFTIPGQPSNIVIKSADSSLRISWGKTKDAISYKVYYREQGSDDFIQFGSEIASTSTIITGLTNGTTYEVAVKAGNKAGFGEYSSIATGVPQNEGFEMPELPAKDRIDASGISIKMTDPNNVNWGLCPNFNVNHLIDNNPNTYWVANNWWYNSEITYTFDTPQDMNYALLVPYLADSHKNVIKTYSIVARDADGNIVSQVNSRAARLTNNYIVLTFPQAKNITSLSISLAEVEGGGARVNISEMAFYNSSTLADDIANLFGDAAFTTLAAGVDAEKITELENQLSAESSYYIDIERLRDEIALAKSLLPEAESKLGLIKNDFVSRSTSYDNSNFGQSASDLQPLGISAKAGATIALYADIPDGESVYVVPTQFYGESGVWKGSPIKLEKGRNYISVPKIGSLSDTRGGSLYLTYSGDNAQQIKIQVRGNENAMYKIPTLELSNWYNMREEERKQVISAYIDSLTAYVQNLNVNSGALKTDIRNITEISTPSVLLSMPADQILEGLKAPVGESGLQAMYSDVFSVLSEADTSSMTDMMYDNVLAWEEEMFVANMVQGIISAETDFTSYKYPMTTRQNIRYMRMFAGAFMYAAGNHIGVEYGSCAALAQGKPTSKTSGKAENGLFGWGIAHEIGHNMDKIGYAEITNNIYSLAMQAWDGNAMKLNTRLTHDERWEKIFNKVAQARPGMANDVFVQLGMYWQLHLAYDNADSPLAFYNQFFTDMKSGKYSEYTKDERIALIASDIADRDLSEFFTRWGMTLGETALQQIKTHQSENRAIWYLNDASRNARLESAEPNAGTTTVSASVSENNITLNISNTDSSTILGYEIIRNGKSIAFTTETTYIDNVGAANNVTYTYEVIPVDKLGNMGAKVESNEVRVAYDKTISSELYEMSKSEDGIITITMKQDTVVPVSGIKITGSDLTGSVKAEVKANSSDELWTVAKENAEISGNSNVIYFNKPGVDSMDTRIWTYDTAVMQISGVPEGATVELLDYPGDRVDFYNGAAVGILKSDYTYGNAPEQVIPEGTLVILGTYRGDPNYNYVEVQAEYNTTTEAAEANGVTTIKRAMNGYGLMFAEIPADGAVSDTSDGFFIFVPDLEAEEELNKADGVTDKLPLEIKVNMYRTDSAESSDSKRLTSETLWLGFPDEESLPLIELTGNSADNYHIEVIK